MQTHTASRNKTFNRESCKHLQTFIAVIRTCILELNTIQVVFCFLAWYDCKYAKGTERRTLKMLYFVQWSTCMIDCMYAYNRHVQVHFSKCGLLPEGNEWKWGLKRKIRLIRSYIYIHIHIWCPVEAQQWNCNYFRSNRVALRKAFCLHFVTLTASAGVDHQCWMECRDKGAEMSWERGASMIALLRLSGSNSPSMRNLSALFCAYQEVFGPGPENSMKLVSAGGIKPTSASTLAQIRIVKLHDVCH